MYFQKPVENFQKTFGHPENKKFFFKYTNICLNWNEILSGANSKMFLSTFVLIIYLESLYFLVLIKHEKKICEHFNQGNIVSRKSCPWLIEVFWPLKYTDKLFILQNTEENDELWKYGT